MGALAVAVYLTAIVTANLLAAEFGPSITVFSAFMFIGLDLSLRDYLHDRWANALIWRMGALIAVGGLASYVLNPAAGRIAVASTVAFVLAATADAVVYHLARNYPKLAQMNASNIVGAGVDSILFPTLAFGGILPWVTLGQFLAKVFGGAVWSLVIVGARRAVASNEG